MCAAAKKTRSLPPKLTRRARIEQRLYELRTIQRYWSGKAHERGILAEEDLERYLRA